MADAGYMTEYCPNCLAFIAEGLASCPVCGHGLPVTYVLPYDDEPWEYSDFLLRTFKKYSGLRLMAKYRGRNPERLGELSHCRYLYLSRYAGFQFSFLRNFVHLDTVELDLAPIVEMHGVEQLEKLCILKLTECRHLERIDSLSACRTLKLLSIVLCNRILSYAPIESIHSLEQLTIEARSIDTLEFLRALPKLRFLGLIVQRIETGDLAPLFSLRNLDRLVISKKIARLIDLDRLRQGHANGTVELV